uniref:Uncharacterized protein n=1 Tax=Melanopsichium pennsylvanicum 4 TaxID=1398559 RepID=A0A077R3K7_9BASI|nr:uncharacterized protein BN887_06111 [Melanopsichium pennsylvanicum 4]
MKLAERHSSVDITATRRNLIKAWESDKVEWMATLTLQVDEVFVVVVVSDGGEEVLIQRFQYQACGQDLSGEAGEVQVCRMMCIERSETLQEGATAVSIAYGFTIAEWSGQAGTVRHKSTE